MYLIAIVEEIQPISDLIVIGGAVICALFLMHLLEFITGVPFMELSNRWDELQGWQKGIMGIVGCGFLTTIIILVMGSILPKIVEKY